MVPATEIPGVDASSLSLPTFLQLVPCTDSISCYDQLVYLDTAVTLIPSLDDDGNPQFEIDESGNPVPILEPLEVEIGGVNYTGTPFLFQLIL